MNRMCSLFKDENIRFLKNLKKKPLLYIYGNATFYRPMLDSIGLQYFI